MVYGHQQLDVIEQMPLDKMYFAYHCVALVKRKEAEAVAAERKRLDEEAGR